MELPHNCSRMKIYIGEEQRIGGVSAYEYIVSAARKNGLAGATAQRAFMGFGAQSRLRTSKVLSLSQDLPVVVEIVDTQEKIDEFYNELEPQLEKGLVTVEEVDVRFYEHIK
ncbi:MAG: DUF190 domain-containing protein [Desulfovibrio sp.]